MSEIVKATGMTFEQLKKGALAVHFAENPQREFRPIDAVGFRKFIPKPVKIITYRNITFNIEDPENLIIEGKEGCPERIITRFFDLLYCFPVLENEEIDVYDEIRDCNTTDTVLSPTSEIDHIKKITIKGHFKYLDASEKDREPAFKTIRLPPKYENEDSRPLRFCYLETIDLSECVDLQFISWYFLSCNMVKTVILPEHPIKADCSDPSTYMIKIEEVVNKNYVSVDNNDGCCIIE